MERKKISKIEISKKDLENLQDFKFESIKKNNNEYLNLVIKKPWGYEYILFQNHKIAIWLLHISKGHSTSMHCHPNKKTSLLLLSGEGICTTLNQQTHLTEKEGIIIEKGVFHKTEALSEGGVYLIEIETPIDKEDLFRLKDNYAREKESYTKENNITRELNKYKYQFIEDEVGEQILFKTNLLKIADYSEIEVLDEDLKRGSPGVGAILSGKIRTKEGEISVGDIFHTKKINLLEIPQKTRILFLERISKEQND